MQKVSWIQKFSKERKKTDNCKCIIILIGKMNSKLYQSLEEEPYNSTAVGRMLPDRELNQVQFLVPIGPSRSSWIGKSPEQECQLFLPKTKQK